MPLADFRGVCPRRMVADGLCSPGGKTRASERLSELSNPAPAAATTRSRPRRATRCPRCWRWPRPAFSKPLQPKTELEQGKLKAKLAAAGFRGDSAGGSFLGLKLIGLMIGLLTFGSGMLAFSGMSQKTLIYTVFGAGVLVLSARFRRRIPCLPSQKANFSYAARRPRPDGRLRRGRAGLGPGDAQSERRDETQLPESSARNSA